MTVFPDFSQILRPVPLLHFQSSNVTTLCAFLLQHIPSPPQPPSSTRKEAQPNNAGSSPHLRILRLICRGIEHHHRSRGLGQVWGPLFCPPLSPSLIHTSTNVHEQQILLRVENRREEGCFIAATQATSH